MNLFNFLKKDIASSDNENSKNQVQRNELLNFFKWKKIRNYLFIIFSFIGLFYALMTIAIYVVIDYRDNTDKYINFFSH